MDANDQIHTRICGKTKKPPCDGNSGKIAATISHTFIHSHTCISSQCQNRRGKISTLRKWHSARHTQNISPSQSTRLNRCFERIHNVLYIACYPFEMVQCRSDSPLVNIDNLFSTLPYILQQTFTSASSVLNFNAKSINLSTTPFKFKSKL